MFFHKIWHTPYAWVCYHGQSTYFLNKLGSTSSLVFPSVIWRDIPSLEGHMHTMEKLVDGLQWVFLPPDHGDHWIQADLLYLQMIRTLDFLYHNMIAITCMVTMIDTALHELIGFLASNHDALSRLRIVISSRNTSSGQHLLVICLLTQSNLCIYWISKIEGAFETEHFLQGSESLCLGILFSWHQPICIMVRSVSMARPKYTALKNRTGVFTPYSRG